MMNDQISYKDLMIKYGLIIGFVKVFIEMLNYNFGNIYQRPWWAGLLGFAVFIGFIIKAVSDVKNRNGGYLTLKDAIKTGLGVSLIAGIIGAVFMYILIHYIEPGYIENALEYQENMMIEKNPDMDEEMLETAMSFTRKFMSPGILYISTLVSVLLGGLFYSFIAGLIMQKKPETF